jgi:hypothetical protein
LSNFAPFIPQIIPPATAPAALFARGLPPTLTRLDLAGVSWAPIVFRDQFVAPLLVRSQLVPNALASLKSQAALEGKLLI